jgi:hypothetical protein
MKNSKNIECNELCSKLREESERSNHRNAHFVCELIQSLKNHFLRLLNQKNSKILKLEKSLNYFEENFIKVKQKLNLLSKNLIKIKNFKGKEAAKVNLSQSSDIHNKYFLIKSSNKKNPQNNKNNSKFQFSYKLNQTKFKICNNSNINHSILENHSLNKPKKNLKMNLKTLKPKSKKLRKKQRKKVKSIGVSKEIKFLPKNTKKLNNIKDAVRNNYFSQNSNLNNVIVEENVIYRKKLFGSKSHRIKYSPKKPEIYLSNISKMDKNVIKKNQKMVSKISIKVNLAQAI